MPKINAKDKKSKIKVIEQHQEIVRRGRHNQKIEDEQLSKKVDLKINQKQDKI